MPSLEVFTITYYHEQQPGKNTPLAIYMWSSIVIQCKKQTAEIKMSNWSEVSTPSCELKLSKEIKEKLDQIFSAFVRRRRKQDATMGKHTHLVPYVNSALSWTQVLQKALDLEGSKLQLYQLQNGKEK